MKIDWLNAGMGGGALMLLVIGFVTGRMPMLLIETDRRLYPLGFWATGGAYMAIAAFCLSLTAADLLCS